MNETTAPALLADLLAAVDAPVDPAREAALDVHYAALNAVAEADRGVYHAHGVFMFAVPRYGYGAKSDAAAADLAAADARLAAAHVALAAAPHPDAD